MTVLEQIKELYSLAIEYRKDGYLDTAHRLELEADLLNRYGREPILYDLCLFRGYIKG